MTLFLLLIIVSSNGQTCCSAGAPVSTSFMVSSSADQSMSLELRYEFKSINRLVDNNVPITNDLRTRSGQNLSLRWDYGFYDDWAIGVFLPFVYQERSTFSVTNSSIGIGDMSIVIRRSLVFNNFSEWGWSSAIKIPTGKNNHTNDTGIFLSPDMQSGSGSVDYLIGTDFTSKLSIMPSMNIHLALSYKWSGVNDSFAQQGNFNGRRFGFGDEFILLTSISHTFLSNIGFLIPDLGLQFRYAEPNIEHQVEAPNSGGSWWSLPLGFSIVKDQKWSFRLFGDFPFYQKLEGLQITTDYSLGLQIKYQINK